MICPHCGENNPDNAKYCSRCSATLPRKQRPAGQGGRQASQPGGGGGGIDPKTIIIIILAVLVVIGGIVFIRSKMSDKDKDTVEETTTEEKSEETTEEETEEATEEATEESNDEAEAGPDWLEEHGLAISANEAFTFNTMMNDGDEDTEEMEVSAKITVEESTENMPDGYKLVTATFVYNISDSDGERGILADGAFDRYTGTYFGFENEQPEQDEDNKPEQDGAVRITNGDDHYDIAIATTQKTEEPIVTKTITVACPTDYDGAVFFAGYSSMELDEKLKKLNPAERLYTFDELPFMDDDHECYYFVYQEPDDNGRSSWGAYDVSSSSSEDSESDSQQSGPPR